MSSTGYGDIHAHDRDTQLISIVVMLIGLLLYGYCLSTIAATIANSAAPKWVSKVEFLNVSAELLSRKEDFPNIFFKEPCIFVQFRKKKRKKKDRLEVKLHELCSRNKQTRFCNQAGLFSLN